jgi:hypothetical protein
MMLTDTEIKSMPEWKAIEVWWDSGNENNELLYGIIFKLISAVIAANNAKALADLNPAARFIYAHGHLTQVLLGNKDGIDMYPDDQVSALIQRNAELEGIRKEVVGCFDAADAEGMWEEVSASSDHLKDLYQRRILHARYAAEKITS